MKKYITTIILIILYLGVIAQSLTYTYDDFNRLISTEYPNGQVITYQYDLLGNRVGYEITSNVSNHPHIIFVKGDATGNNTGVSWDNAFTTLSGAIAFAESAPIVTQIWIAAGTYYPTTCNPCSDSDRLVSFRLGDNIGQDISIIGGFVGNEPPTLSARNARNLLSNPVYLSGDIGVANDNSDNSYTVVEIHNLYHNLTFDGIIIEEGNSLGMKK